MREITRVTPSWAGVTTSGSKAAGLQYPVTDHTHPARHSCSTQRSHGGRSGQVRRVEYTDPSSSRRRVSFRHEHGPPAVPLAHRTNDAPREVSMPASRRRSSRFTPTTPKRSASGRASWVRLTSRRNSMVSAARISERVAPGQVFVPVPLPRGGRQSAHQSVLDPYAKNGPS